MKRVGMASVLLGLVFLWGCGRDEEPADAGAEVPPGSVAVSDQETEDQAGKEEPADPGAAIDQAADAADGQKPSGENDQVAVARKAAEGKLAAHASALSMVTPGHFALIKLDVDKIRNASLTKKLPMPLEELAADELPPGMDEVIREVETIWVALSPGTGKLEDFFGRAESSKVEAIGETIDDEFEPPPEEFDLPGDEDFDNEDFDAAAPDELQAPDGDFEDPMDAEIEPLGDEDFSEVEGEDVPPDFGPPGAGEVPPEFGPPGGEVPAPPVNFSVYARFKTAEALNSLLANAPPMDGAEEIAYGEDLYFKAKGAPLWIKSRDRELFASTDEAVIKGVIDTDGKLVDAPLIDRLEKTNVDAHLVVCASLDPIRPQVSELISDPEAGFPPQVKGVFDAVAALSLAVDLEGPEMFDLDVDATDDDSAGMLRDMANGLIGMGSQGLAEGQKQIEQRNAPEGAAEMLEFGQKALSAIAVEKEGSQVAVSFARPDELEDVVGKAMAAAAEAQKAARKAMSAQYLGLAAFNHQAVHGQMPSGIEKDGERLLSWRVQILPYLESANLYEMIQHDEAWDSENNKQVLEEMPEFLATSSVTKPGMTTWRMLPGRLPDDIMFIDAGKGKEVPWTQPDEFEIDVADPLAALGEEPEGGYMAVFRDGHVQAMTSDAIKAHFAGKESTPHATDLGEPDGDSPDDETPDEPTVDDSADVVREWTDSTGTKTVRATLLKVEEGNVTLQRADNGKEVTLPIDKLSDADQAYLKEIAKE